MTSEPIGTGSPSPAIVPFRVDIPQSDLDDLRARLDRTRWTDEIPGTEWTYGVDLTSAKELLDAWRSDYDWRVIETRLNAYPQCMTSIDGLDIHYLHVRSVQPDATPLLMIHGWPDSVLRYADVIDPLTDPAANGALDAPAFDLVIPSIPGYGFSSRPVKPGWGTHRTGAAFAELMHRVGYDHYAVHGGDLGSSIAGRSPLPIPTMSSASTSSNSSRSRTAPTGSSTD